MTGVKLWVSSLDFFCSPLDPNPSLVYPNICQNASHQSSCACSVNLCHGWKQSVLVWQAGGSQRDLSIWAGLTIMAQIPWIFSCWKVGKCLILSDLPAIVETFHGFAFAETRGVMYFGDWALQVISLNWICEKGLPNTWIYYWWTLIHSESWQACRDLCQPHQSISSLRTESESCFCSNQRIPDWLGGGL